MAEKNIHLDISGMTCVNCSNGISKVVGKMDGLQESKVNFTSNSGDFIIDDKKLSKEELITKITKLGYGVQETQEALQKTQEDAYKKLKQLFIVALTLTVTIFALMLVDLGLWHNYVIFALASVIQFYPGARFYTLAYKALSHKNYDMNVLVALGTSAAYFYSTVVVFFPQLFSDHLRFIYFDGAAVIITFILLGKLLEESTKGKATSYLKTLMKLSPKYAIKLQGKEQEKVLAAALNIDDIILIKQGEKIPCDAVIVEGSADIDAAIITGESMPVYKSIDDTIFAGTLNTNGLIQARVSKTSNDTTLANIIKLINQAQSQSIPIARFADKVANIFVPTVILLSLGTFLVWYLFIGDTLSAILAAISVLIISCPCALGLATPIAIVTAVGKGAKEGILIKNPEVLEIISDIKYAVFDKTGTLTQGEISVKSSNLDNETLSVISSIEALSEHPISHAIVNYTKEKKLHQNLEITQLKQITGRGIKASYQNKRYLIGSLKLLQEHQVVVENSDIEHLDQILNQGYGAVLIAIDNTYVGIISLEDALKDGVKDLMQFLYTQNITPMILSGDTKLTVAHIAKEVGVEIFHSDVTPDEKFKLIKNLQNKAPVMFIGDGVNDSPSLKQANIGIAMSSGADISKEAGDIILTHNELNAIKKSIVLSKKAMINIKQNLFFAFIYNAIGIPLAMGLFYPLFGVMLTPMFAGIAMSFSSVSVVLNALRLKIVKL